MFKLQNVRRASGDAGRLSGFTEIVNETETNVFIKPNGTTTPWPGSLYLVVSRVVCFFFISINRFLILIVGFSSTTSDYAAAIVNPVALNVFIFVIGLSPLASGTCILC